MRHHLWRMIVALSNLREQSIICQEAQGSGTEEMVAPTCGIALLVPLSAVTHHPEVVGPTTVQ